MASKTNRVEVPEAKAAMDRFKTEVASELGVNLKEGYNGDLTSKEAGSIGGEMVRRMIKKQEEYMKSALPESTEPKRSCTEIFSVQLLTVSVSLVNHALLRASHSRTATAIRIPGYRHTCSQCVSFGQSRVSPCFALSNRYSHSHSGL